MSLLISKRQRPGENGTTFTYIKTASDKYSIDEKLVHVSDGKIDFTVDKAVLDFADQQWPQKHGEETGTFDTVSGIIDGSFKMRMKDPQIFLEALMRFGTYDPVNAARYLLTPSVFEQNAPAAIVQQVVRKALNVALDNLPGGTDERKGAIDYILRLADLMLHQFKNVEVNVANLAAKAIIADAEERKEGLLDGDTSFVVTNGFYFAKRQIVVGKTGKDIPVYESREEVFHALPGIAASIAHVSLISPQGYLVPHALSDAPPNERDVDKKQRLALATRVNTAIKNGEGVPLRQYIQSRLIPAEAARAGL